MILRLYAHLIESIKDGVKDVHFHTIDIVHNTADMLAKMFNGKASCSSDDTVQYHDTVEIDLDKKYLPTILKSFPFVRKIK